MKLYFYILDNDREFNPETRTFGDPVFKVRVEECEVALNDEFVGALKLAVEKLKEVK